MTMRRATLAAALAAAIPPAAAPAQDFNEELADAIREELTEQARNSDLGNAFQALTIFGAAPGISAATFNVEEGGEELDLNSIKLSPSHTFDPVFGVKPYVEATFGYLNTDQTVDVGLDTSAAVDIDTLTVLGGVGVELDLFEGTVIRPIALVGYSHTSDEAETRGPFAEELAVAGRGIVFDVRINSLLLGGVVELEHGRAFAGDINLDARLRYAHLHDAVLNASDPVLESDGDFGVLTGRAEVDGPLFGATLFGRQLRWIGFASSTYLPGDQGDDLGFSYFFELGGGLEIVDREVISGVEGVSVRASGIIGENVTGWTAGLSIEF